jgi:hypothetical protein
MRTILRVGTNNILLANDVNVADVTKILDGSIAVKKDYSDRLWINKDIGVDIEVVSIRNEAVEPQGKEEASNE